MKCLLASGICLLGALPAVAQDAAFISAGTAARNSGAISSGTISPSHVHPAVARIVAPGKGSISYGSGTLVYANDQIGLVVTNWHVINEATEMISVHFPDGFYSLGTVQRVDRDWDLALVAIRRPNVEPVRLADQAPRPGEMLTIAGYGSGQYRSASGPCTQYVAPGKTFPFEMVELAASARQGDSGGPIFNSRGELAGVLFGEGQGRTSGSYCGRVRWFLTSLVPSSVDNSTLLAAAPPRATRPSSSVAPGESEARPIGIAPVPLVQTSATSSHAMAPAAAMGVVASTRGSEDGLPQVQHIGWEDLAGETTGEQVKSVLAGIGALALILHLLRWVGRERAAK